MAARHPRLTEADEAAHASLAEKHGPQACSFAAKLSIGPMGDEWPQAIAQPEDSGVPNGRGFEPGPDLASRHGRAPSGARRVDPLVLTVAAQPSFSPDLNPVRSCDEDRGQPEVRRGHDAPPPRARIIRSIRVGVGERSLVPVACGEPGGQSDKRRLACTVLKAVGEPSWLREVPRPQGCGREQAFQ